MAALHEPPLHPEERRIGILVQDSLVVGIAGPAAELGGQRGIVVVPLDNEDLHLSGGSWPR
jgi:hypothetical protein